MSIRGFAVAAWRQSVPDREAEARAVLADRLAPLDVSGLDVFWVYESGDITVYIFGDGHTFLSSRTDGQKWWVDLVNNDSGWTKQAGPITSLIQLGEILDGLPEPDPEPEYPEWYQRHSPDGWPEGSIVRFEGQLWQSTVDNNTWSPGAYGWGPV